MSLFQCGKCGCMENTASTNAAYLTELFTKEDQDKCRQVLGLDKTSELGQYCCVCTPVWFDEHGNKNFGVNPQPKPGQGLWHNRFPRIYLPKGEFETAPNGSLRHKQTLETDVKKFAREIEYASK